MSQHFEPSAASNAVVTPEAVLLDFEIAGIGSRTAALWIDYLIRILMLVIIAVGGSALESAAGDVIPNWIGVTILILTLFGVVVLYPLIFEAMWGKTPGKAALGLRVVTTEGAPINFRQATVRAAIGLFEVFGTSGVVAAVAMVANPKAQRLGDMAAGTMVLRHRQAAKAPAATAFVPPAGAEDYAATLDVSTLSNQDYDAIRSFLVRAPHLATEPRQEVGANIATRFVGRLNTDPPQWLTAEGFLSCVAAAYQRRFNIRS